MTIQVLIVDEDNLKGTMLASALTSWGYSPTIANSEDDAKRQLLDSRSIQLVILDGEMPGIDVRSFCKSLRKTDYTSVAYIVVLTSRDSLEDNLRGFEDSVDDIVVSPFHSSELRMRLRTGARILRLQDQMERSSTSPDRKSSRDSLTGVGNRESILNTLNREIARQKRHKYHLSVLSLDLDNFTSVNETLGNAIGDFVLREAGNRISTCVRAHDSCGRTGADEFLILLPATTPDQALLAARRLYHQLCSTPIQLDDRSLQISCSIGITTIEAETPETPQVILETVENAMYSAKQSGGSQIQFQSTAILDGVRSSSLRQVVCSQFQSEF